MATTPALFPSAVLTRSHKRPVMVELKNGTSYNGVLVSSDRWMNLVVVDAVITFPDGATFQRCEEVCIRGSSVRTVRVVQEALQAPPPPQEHSRPSAGQKRKGQDRSSSNARRHRPEGKQPTGRQ